MDELEFYNGKYSGGEIDDAITLLNRDEIIKVTLTGMTGANQNVFGIKNLVNARFFPQMARITADHVVIAYEFSNPSAVVGAFSITTNTDYISWNGRLDGTTDLTIYLGKVGYGETDSP